MGPLSFMSAGQSAATITQKLEVTVAFVGYKARNHTLNVPKTSGFLFLPRRRRTQRVSEAAATTHTTSDLAASCFVLLHLFLPINPVCKHAGSAAALPHATTVCA